MLVVIHNDNERYITLYICFLSFYLPELEQKVCQYNFKIQLVYTCASETVQCIALLLSEG